MNPSSEAILDAPSGPASVLQLTNPAVPSQQDFDDYLGMVHDVADEIAAFFGAGAEATVSITIHRASPETYHALPNRVTRWPTDAGVSTWRQVAMGPTVNSRICVHCAERPCSDQAESEHLLSESAFAILKARDEAS